MIVLIPVVMTTSRNKYVSVLYCNCITSFMHIREKWTKPILVRHSDCRTVGGLQTLTQQMSGKEDLGMLKFNLPSFSLL